MMKSLSQIVNSEIAVKTEWKNLNLGLLDKGDIQIAESFEGKKIFESSIQEIKVKLAYIFTLIGLTKYPSDEEFIVLHDFLLSNFGKLTLNEMVTAFQLAIKGETDCNSEHYEKFSPKYVSQILKAYISRANFVRKQLSYKQLENQNEDIIELQDDDIVNYTHKVWQESKKDDFNKIFNADKVFNILMRQGKLSFLSKEKIDEIIKMVKEDNLDRKNKMSHIDAKEFSKKIKDDNFLENQCKKLAIVYYFQNMAD